MHFHLTTVLLIQLIDQHFLDKHFEKTFIDIIKVVVLVIQFQC